MSKLIDLAGVKFGRWTVVRRGVNSKKQTTWECQCECGNQGVVQGWSLRSGDSNSCGCLKIEATKKSNTKHGKSYTREFKAWMLMKNRCLNPNFDHYDRYGGRGITVCKDWLDSFESFYECLGDKPSISHSLDRINNDGNYEPSNCRWSTKKEQANNRCKPLKTINLK